MTPEELADIRKKFISGDYTYLKRLYTEYKSDCMRIVLSKNLCDEIQAEDFFTESLLVFRDNLISGKIKFLSNPKSYLSGICINLARDLIQKERRKEKKIDQLRLLYDEYDYNEIDVAEPKQELIAICKKALSLLSERCQQVLVAFYVHRLSMKEIAQELGLSSGDVAKTIKSRCYKSWIEHSKKLKHF